MVIVKFLMGRISSLFLSPLTFLARIECGKTHFSILSPVVCSSASCEWGCPPTHLRYLLMQPQSCPSSMGIFITCEGMSVHARFGLLSPLISEIYLTQMASFDGGQIPVFMSLRSLHTVSDAVRSVASSIVGARFHQ
jgi:hypothetical protein